MAHIPVRHPFGARFARPNRQSCRFVEPMGSFTQPSPPHTKKAPGGAFLSGGGEGGIDGAHPCAPPLRGALRASKSAILPICRTNGSIHTTLSATYQKGPLVGPFRYVAERVGFEPTVRLPVLLISSQAHSTT